MIYVDIFINIIESFTFMFFIFLCCHKNKGILPLIIASITKVIITTICNYYLLPEVILTILSLITIFIYAIYINPHKIIQNCFLVLCSHILCYSSVSLGMVITNILFGFPFYSGSSYIFLLFITKILFLIFVFIVAKYLKNFNFLETKKYKYIFISMFCLEFLYSLLIDDIFYNETFQNTQILLLLIINILAFYFCVILYQFQEEQEHILELQKEQFMLKNEENIQRINKQNMDSLLSWKHDMKHIFSSLDYYLINKNIDKARQMIAQQQNILDNSQLLIHTGNNLIDYLIAQRYDEIVNNHIYFSIDYDKSNIPIEDTHFLIILGNLLDNAIENCSSQYQKNIKLTIGEICDYSYIKIENTISKSVLENNPNLLTTKKDIYNHGIGITNIKLLINQYQGEISFLEKNNYFIVRLLIPTSK